jgi:flagellar basal-body rod protein FlgB
VIYRQFLFKEKLPLINKALDAYSMRQKVSAQNIANATTPGYSPQKVSFEEQFQKEGMVLAGLRDDDMHIPIGTQDSREAYPEAEAAEVPEPDIYFSGDSHVNIDKEMTELAENQIRFRLASRMAGKYFQEVSSAISGVVAR